MNIFLIITFFFILPSALTVDSIGDLGVRPGESNPARMLAGVLLLTVAMMVLALTLAWWLV